MPATQPLNQPSRVFVAEFDQCETHGEFPLNVQAEDGSVRWMQPRCPKCARQSGANRLLTDAQIPVRFLACDFASYIAETDLQKSVLAKCKAYADAFPEHLENGTNLLLCGQPGTGKNHLATAIIKAVLPRGYTALRVKAQQFLDEYWSKPFAERETWLHRLGSVDLLMLDEIGRSSSTKSAQDAFFRLIDARYEAKLPTLLTTNLNRDDLASDEVLGPAAYDRLTQGGSIRLTLNWDSYRRYAK